MNGFDAVVYLGLIIAVVIGFNTGLLRSAIAILAYIAAMPIAMRTAFPIHATSARMSCSHWERKDRSVPRTGRWHS